MKKLIKGICVFAVVVLALSITIFASGCGRNNNKFNNGSVEICVATNQNL